MLTPADEKFLAALTFVIWGQECLKRNDEVRKPLDCGLAAEAFGRINAQEHGPDVFNENPPVEALLRKGVADDADRHCNCIGQIADRCRLQQRGFVIAHVPVSYAGTVSITLTHPPQPEAA